MNRKSGRQIGAAIEACIDLFYITRNPHVSVTKTLDTLTRIGWKPADVGRVERIVRRALAITTDDRAIKNAA